MSQAPKILIATPVHGRLESVSIALGYHNAILGVVAGRDPHYRVVPCVYGADLVRARSRLVREFLSTDCTHLLWWDADVVASTDQAGRLIARLVETGHALVGCVYPKKRIHWDHLADLAAGRSVDPEALAYDYPFRLAKDAKVDVTRCVEVEGLPMGFTLCSRRLLSGMVHYYREILGFIDLVGDERAPTAALFQLMFKDVGGERLLLGEDYSFCERARFLGERAMLYVGEDSALGHVGTHLYQGRREGVVTEA